MSCADIDAACFVSSGVHVCSTLAQVRANMVVLAERWLLRYPNHLAVPDVKEALESAKAKRSIGTAILHVVSDELALPFVVVSSGARQGLASALVYGGASDIRASTHAVWMVHEGVHFSLVVPGVDMQLARPIDGVAAQGQLGYEAYCLLPAIMLCCCCDLVQEIAATAGIV